MEFLSLRSIYLIPVCLKICNLFDGIYFAGWRLILLSLNFIHFDSSRKFLQGYKRSLKLVFLNSFSFDILYFVKQVNIIILNFISKNYFLDLFWDYSNELDVYLYKLLWHWLKKRHSRKSNSWIYLKYWVFISGKWRFHCFDNITGKIYFLKSHAILFTKFYVLPSSVKTSCLLYSEKVNRVFSKSFKPFFSRVYKSLFFSQNGICFLCNNRISLNSIYELRICKYLSSFDVCENRLSKLVLVHRYCC
uniref:RoaA protein n=1 Tax=Monomorphina aenigmatica TaxID=304863 RepID=L0BIQ4_MONAE|nr:RoaA protein [Monomorphina aenigmatica]AFZ88809.1 RoaA protein [Monomorphina aenigmatica]